VRGVVRNVSDERLYILADLQKSQTGTVATNFTVSYLPGR
jgi:hypothetical protein